METNEKLKVDVKQCARCGSDHPQLKFRKFIIPISDSDNTEWNYWALCPITQEPILLRVKDEQNS